MLNDLLRFSLSLRPSLHRQESILIHHFQVFLYHQNVFR
ncbi:hypothetical protein SynPROS71_01503 [Synechococcus sp. PROS-7-1]|nr:hypothetical protein SynPROS71_01503 [Synechococcus sp. PROS-7-1]